MDVEFPGFWDALEEVPPPCGSHALTGHAAAQALMLSAARGGHHALILDGERGIGKATAAFQLANAVLADLPLDGETIPLPDIQSATWRQIAQNAHPNLLYLTRPPTDDGKGFKQVITVDEVRRLNRFLGLSASGNGRRIVIIDAINDMNVSAANAVLKLLEEPPSKTFFLLISNGMGGILPTIRSRCQLIRFACLSDRETEEVIRRVAPDLGEGGRLAALSGGSVRHGLELALHGGLELMEALGGLVDNPRYDTALAHKLADAAAQRGDTTHARLLRGMIVDVLHRNAQSQAMTGSVARAERIARFASDFEERAIVADAYNLDRRQEFLVTAAQLHELIHAG